MFSLLKKNIKVILFWLLVLVGCVYPVMNQTFATYAPKYDDDYVGELREGKWVWNPSGVKADKKLRENIVELFYPSRSGWNLIYNVLKDITLWLMIGFFVWAWASILFNRKPEDVKKTLRSLVYVFVWWLFIYWANWIFWDVLNFNEDSFTVWEWVNWLSDAAHGVFFVILSALKAFAFFLAIIVLVITWFRVIAAGEWEKWKKLVKWIINVVIALMIIKGIDFIYYIAQDTANFVKNAADLIINVAKVFAYVFWVIIVIMVIIAWYFYMTDGWGGSNFKKASNILVNILLSGLVLFAFLLILYQVFAEFQTDWDAVTDPTAFLMVARSIV